MKEADFIIAPKGFEIPISEFRRKGLVGRVMYEIASVESTWCRDKELYMEILETTAKSIIAEVRKDLESTTPSRTNPLKTSPKVGGKKNEKKSG